MTVEFTTVRSSGPIERRVVDANVLGQDDLHRIGWLSTFGWYCACSKAGSCPKIAPVKALVPADLFPANGTRKKPTTATRETSP